MTPNGTRLALMITTDAAQMRALGGACAKAHWRLIMARNAEEAIAMLGTHDGMMLDGVLVESCADADVITALHGRRPALPIIVQTTEIGGAVAALRSGATDCLVKPATPERWMRALEQATTHQPVKGELRPLSEKLATQLGFDEIVGSDPRYRNALAIAAKSARGRFPVLISGEAGVGKDAIANAIRAASPRDKRPFVHFDCADMAPNAIDSELFGHEKNAFTGAFSRQQGAVHTAEAGTLFIDNIELLPLSAQAGLFRLVERQEVRPLGTNRADMIDVRVIAATNGTLEALVEAELFREDLFYKLSAVHVELPPLRERRADIPPLVRHLLARICSLPMVRGLGVTDAAMEVLSAYVWPGNIRQLQGTLLRAAIACDGDALTAADFPNIVRHLHNTAAPTSHAGGLAGGITLFGTDGHMRALEVIEADVIRLAIGHYGGRMAEVARRLGIGRSTLYRKLIELGITDVA